MNNTFSAATTRRSRLAAVAFAIATLAEPAAAQVPDASRGRALYENHCIACHTERIHSRPNRVALTRAEVREIVEHWQRQQGLAWTPQDTEDVVEFLGRSRYRYAPVAERLTRP